MFKHYFIGVDATDCECFKIVFIPFTSKQILPTPVISRLSSSHSSFSPLSPHPKKAVTSLELR
jgi:hypothetical protein